MAAEQDKKFPTVPLKQFETDLIVELCGGKPLTSPEGIDQFFKWSVDPKLSSSRLPLILPTIGYRSADIMDVNPAEGTRAFMRGAKFYAGVLATVRNLDAIPCVVPVVRDLVNEERGFWLRTEPDTSDLYLAYKVSERVIKEAESFCVLMDDARRALEIDSPDMYKLARVGAGVMHSVVADTLAYSADTDVTSLEDNPGLHGLEDLFARIDLEFGNMG